MALPDFKSKVDSLLNVAIPTFGETVTYIPKNGKGPYRMLAVFDREHLFIDPDTETVVASNDPKIGVNLNNMKERPQQGDQVKILDELFHVDDAQEDGQGGAALIIHRLDSDSEA